MVRVIPGFGCGFSGFFSCWFGVDCLGLESVLDLLPPELLPEPDLVKLGLEVVFCSCCWLALPLFFGAIHTAMYTPIPAPISVRITTIITSFVFSYFDCSKETGYVNPEVAACENSQSIVYNIVSAGIV